jgi:hypothetical protein
MTTYTEAELIEAAGTLPWLQRVFDRSGACPWTRETLEHAAADAGNINSLKALLDRIDKNRKPRIVNRDDTLTYGELESYFHRQKIYNGYGKLNIDEIAQDIEAHREKLLDGRTYRSAENHYYRWVQRLDGFMIMGVSGIVKRDVPKRPLELLP